MTNLPDLNWLLTGFTERTTGVIEAVVVSVDGLLIATSQGLDRATADQVAAVAAGLASLTRGAARLFDAGDVRQVMVSLDHGYIILTAVGNGAALAVLADAGSDVGLVGYEMTVLARQVGGALSPELIEDLRARLPR